MVSARVAHPSLQQTSGWPILCVVCKGWDFSERHEILPLLFLAAVPVHFARFLIKSFPKK
jgi:hypothetical protein